MNTRGLLRTIDLYCTVCSQGLKTPVGIDKSSGSYKVKIGDVEILAKTQVECYTILHTLYEIVTHPWLVKSLKEV